MPLALAYPPHSEHVLRCEPARRAVVSWNSAAPSGAIDLRVRWAAPGTWSPWLPYVEWDERTRSSHSAKRNDVCIMTDVLESDETFDAVETRLTAPATLLALATPPNGDRELRIDATGRHDAACDLDVPQASQYVVADERGWCSPASLAMILRYFGREADVIETAAAVHDTAYGGTGNWTMNVAHAARAGLGGFVAYLRGLDHARRFVEAGIPLALSIAWREGALADAPLPASKGHIVVLRGFDPLGNPIVNDPAAHPVRRTYDRAEFARAWLDHGGIAYVIAADNIAGAAALANA